MMTVGDVLARLDRIAPFAKAGGWDPVGLQLGDAAAPAAIVGVCHEVTPLVVERAVAAGVELLVSYHPLLFRPTRRIVAGPDAVGRAHTLVRNGVALAVVHTAYDVVPGGAADALADALGLEDFTPFGPNWGADAVKIVAFVPAEDADAIAAAMASAGAGRIGAYTGCSFRAAGVGTFVAGPGTDPATGTAGASNAEPEVRLEMIAPAARKHAVVAALTHALRYEEPAYDVYAVEANAGFIGRQGTLAHPRRLDAFADEVGAALDSAVRIAGDRSRTVSRVAVVPGSGRTALRDASAADVIVTGDIGHHDAQAALERGIAVIDPGHAATERPGVARLYAAVAERVDAAVDLTAVEADPWRA
jgi:dinuclear metal center YbgI/SA1388 family protein